MNRTLRTILPIVWLMTIGGLARGAGQGVPEATKISEDGRAGMELWQTSLGRLWIPTPGADVIRHLQWEQTIQRVYDHPQVHVARGDVVIDCGAHIGGFTRVALRAGAQLVVAIEPEKANILAFRKNFEQELKTGRVVLVAKGLWDTPGTLPLHLSSVGDSHSMVVPQKGGKDEVIELTTLDAVAGALKLPRVDFIKMDIEGAEKRALQGSRLTLSRQRPRLAISSYHETGDPAAICRLVWDAYVGYLVTSKDLVQSRGDALVTKVLFFYRPPE